jgi:hypothetical protein
MTWSKRFERLSDAGAVGTVFTATFLYAASVGLVFQLFVLPVLLPQLHAGHGLLVGRDSIGFHEAAEAMARNITALGWSAWDPRSDVQGVISIAALLYALTGVHEPWVMLIFHAALFAGGAAALYRLAFLLTRTRFASAAAFIPFVILPSAILIFADLHKDIWSCVGILFILAGWTTLEALPAPRRWDFVQFALWCCVGIFLIWLVRPYLIKVMLIGLAVAIGLRTVLAIWARDNWRSVTTKLFAYLLCFFVFAVVTKISKSPLMGGAGPVVVPPGLKQPNGFFETSLFQLIIVRQGFLETAAGSVVDRNVYLRSITDIVEYIPRALQIGLFAPFPSMWFTQGYTEGGTIMRMIAAFEMIAAYLLLGGLALLWPKLLPLQRRAFLMVLSICLVTIAIFGIAFPNIGALYRMRYAFYLPVVGLGAAGWVIFLMRKRAADTAG